MPTSGLIADSIIANIISEVHLIVDSINFQLNIAFDSYGLFKQLKSNIISTHENLNLIRKWFYKS